MPNAMYFTDKANECRTLWANILDRNDPSLPALLSMSDEFDKQAAASVALAEAKAAYADNVVGPMQEYDTMGCEDGAA